MAGLGFAVVAPVGIGWAARTANPPQWQADDWGATANSIILAMLFFGLAWQLNRAADARSAAVANGALLATIGQLTMTSSRTFGGSDELALRVATDALAALEHFPLADLDEQTELLRAIGDAYTNLAFGTLNRTPTLPRSQWEELQSGAVRVVRALNRIDVGQRREGNELECERRRVRRHIVFVLQLAKALRRCAPGHDRDVVLFESATLADIKYLYRKELTVIHSWDVLESAPGSVACSIHLIDAADPRIDSWYVPWYVGDDQDGNPMPINVEGKQLEEASRWDRIEEHTRLPRHPWPLQYGQLPAGLRAEAISRLAAVLEQTTFPVASCLAYDVLVDGRLHRAVVDGNHRVAAALRMASPWPHQTTEARIPGRVYLLMYLITEKRPVDSERSTEDRTWRWRGFTPDVARLRALLEGESAGA